MVQDDCKEFGGFSDLLADFDVISSEEDKNIIESRKVQSANNKLMDSVFGSDGDSCVKKISDNNQPLVKNKLKSYHAGHRQRARERFMQLPSLANDVELLELLLFSVIPRADTKQMAYALIDKFKNLRNVSNASVKELDACGANGECLWRKW